MNFVKTMVAFFSLLGFIGCAYYPISKQYREAAAGGPSFIMVKEKPNSFKGKTVIWGGEIINTTIDSQGSQIMVLQTPLDNSGQPRSVMHSQGRFLAVTPTFLDPEIFKASRKVTMAGTVIGYKSMLIDKLKYNYPVINLKQIHIWSITPNYYYPYPGFWWGGGYWNDGFDGEFGDEFYGGYGEYYNEDHNHGTFHEGEEGNRNSKGGNEGKEQQRFEGNGDGQQQKGNEELGKEGQKGEGHEGNAGAQEGHEGNGGPQGGHGSGGRK